MSDEQFTLLNAKIDDVILRLCALEKIVQRMDEYVIK